MVRLQHPNSHGGKLIYDGAEKNTVQGAVLKALVEKQCRGEPNSLDPDGFYVDDAILFVGSGQDINLLDMTTFGRVIGALWANGKRLTQVGLDSGLGRMISKRKRKTTPWPWEAHDEIDN